ncbi:multidrug efflux pump subunit AcrB [Orenia metallireducens]|jgi:multidrug efflux pump subunit AcrB|uniref:Multidrug efflux pump subunit AcrB n=1 Tax=Orenia metallireducens TaxID=1413210 RepID=A0A285HN53_9FIRM|nr:efflux RND transporter permease subunit [Orenia metallireducens]PRX26695.1 multidrug efflux pump subunit AcrB [Orenia metallireducens]SNY36186.1 Multidrug efflux pump subunit AcrB [Orenia metallireducens]
MGFTELAIKKKYVTFTLIALLIIGGVRAYFNLPKSENPGFIIKTATIITYLPGASPDKIENLISDKIEEAVKEIPELDYVESTNKTGFSLVKVNIESKYKDLRPIWDSMRRKVNAIKSQLPSNSIGPIINDEYGDVFGTIIGVTGEDYSYAELEDMVKDMRDELLTIDEVAKVDIVGKQEKRIFIEYDNAKLAELGISPYQLQQILTSRNIILSGGNIELGSERIPLEPTGDYKNLEDIKHTLITLPDGNSVNLEDIAEVREGYIDPARSKMRVDGKQALGLAISMKDGGQITKLGAKVEKKVKYFKRQYPIGVNFDFISLQSKLVEKKVSSFTANLIQSTLTVIAVLLIFLGLKEGLLVSTLVPVVIAITFLLMSIFGIGIDTVSLAALIISLGMLVDNSVVMAESIISKLEEGMGKLDAAISSAKELKVPLLVASLVTCAAFSPIGFAKSDVGEFAGGIFKVVALALMTSWILSLTMVPLFAVLFLKIDKKEEAYDGKVYRVHNRILLTLMKHKIAFVILVLLIIFSGVKGMGLVPKIFMPKDKKTVMTYEVQLPKGTSIERTEEVAKDIDEYIEEQLKVKPEQEEVNFFKQLLAGGTLEKYKDEGILNWGTFIGQGAPRFTLAYSAELNSPEYIYFLINTTSVDVIEELIPKLEGYTIDKFPDTEVKAARLEIMPVGKPIQIRVSGKEMDKLYDIVHSVKDKLRTINGVEDISDDWGLRTKKLKIDIDQDRLEKAGLSNRDVAVSLLSVLDGVQLTEYRKDDDIIPVVLRDKDSSNVDISTLETTKVYSLRTGRSVPLKQIAEIKALWEPSMIYRRDGIRTITVKADTVNGITATEVNNQLKPWLDKEQANWGAGYSYAFGGEYESSTEANESIGAQLPITALVILLLLVIQFNSYKKPLTIILIVPITIVGVAIGLLVTGKAFGFMEILGLISLVGIIVNNSIVLIDRIGIELDEFNRTPQDAILEAAKRRLRSIFLTSATTICGLLPLWFSGDALFGGMAVSLIFGLSFGLLITLIAVPVVYSIVFNIKYKEYNYNNINIDKNMPVDS